MDQEFQELMTDDAIHDFGIEIVVTHMHKDGYEILAVKTDRSINPQILARKDGLLAHVAVRTACYPDKGSLESEDLALWLIRYADENNATSYFAAVGIANAEATSDEDISLPVRGAGFHVAYEGLHILTTSDRVTLWDDLQKYQY